MAASKAFNDVLMYVECSGLNYLIKKSPFSANISIKSSLIKRYNDEATSDNYVVSNEVQKNDDVKKESFEEDDLRKENVSFREKYDAAVKDNDRLESVLVQEKEKVKDLETQIADQRSQLLSVKSERKKSSQRVKVLEEENVRIRLEWNVLKEQVESQEEKIDALKEEKLIIVNKLETCLSEQDILKRDTKQVSGYQCRVCEKTFSATNHLKEHVVEHQRNIYSQTTTENCNNSLQTASHENPESDDCAPYSCFYCGYFIKSPTELEAHKSYECENAKILPNFNFQCDQCSADFEDENDLEYHYESDHPTGFFWCDFCHDSLETLKDLQSHIRTQHVNILPR